MYSSVSVCACLCVCKISQKVMNEYFIKACGEMDPGPGRNHLDFGGDPDSFVDPGSFSRILYQMQIAR